jgi:hypothetical protein
MDEFAGNRVAPPPLPHDLLLEILLRPPPEPIYLFRASLVSKHWRGLVHDAGFLRRFRDFHGGTPPVLGFFNNQPWPPLFIPTACSAAASAAAKMSHKEVWVWDCRHGLALLQNHRHSSALFVWDLVTGDRRYLPMPPATTGVGFWNGALLHAAGHGGDCPSSPFLVLYQCSLDSNGYCTYAYVYSSETGIWTETASIAMPSYSTGIDVRRTALVGNTLHWSLDNSFIFEFDLDNHRLGLTARIPDGMLRSYGWEVVIMPTEDGLLGFAGVDGFDIHLWSMVKSIDGVVTWTRRSTIDLKKLLAPEVVGVKPIGFAEEPRVKPIGFAEEPRMIFIYVRSSIYMLHLKSMQIEEVSEKGTYGSIYPYASFYTPGTSVICDVNALFTLIFRLQLHCLWFDL